MLKRASYILLVLVSLCFFVQGNATVSDTEWITAHQHQTQEVAFSHEETGCVIKDANKHGKDGLCNLTNARKNQLTNERQATAGFISFAYSTPIVFEKDDCIYNWNTHTSHLTAFLKSLLYPKHSFW